MLIYLLTNILSNFIVSWFVDLNQRLCDFDLNQSGTTNFDLIYKSFSDGRFVILI